jgi:hypothetical protein
MPRKVTQPKTAAKKPATDVAGYLASLDGERKTSLSRLRSIILQTVPGAAEMIKSGMPYYEYHGMLCAFASQNGDEHQKGGHAGEKMRIRKGTTVTRRTFALWKDCSEAWRSLKDVDGGAFRTDSSEVSD